MSPQGRQGLTLGDVFTDAQIAEAYAIYQTHLRTGTSGLDLHNKLMLIVQEAMPKINEFTGQVNDVSYFAYMLEYALARNF